MKLSKDDIFNLSCLKLSQMGVWTNERCLETMRFGKKQRTRTQKRYLKKMVEILFKIDSQQPGLLESQLKIELDKKITKEGDTNHE
jgi:hypothetical protein